MEYTTTQNKLILPEYGRNIQKLVNNAVLIEDNEERKKYIDGVINLMARMYPYLKELQDFKHKLWDHLLIMSDFKLAGDSPFPFTDALPPVDKPAKMPYKSKDFKYKHFGRNMVEMLNYAAKLENGEEKILLTALLANHMKKLFLTWSKDIVDDDYIFKMIKEMTDDKLEVDKSIVLSDSGQLVTKQQIHKKRKHK
jgi:hypothetical protein